VQPQVSDHADSLAPGKAEQLTLAHQRHREIHGRAFDLGRPACHVAQEVDCKGHIHVARHHHRLAVVERLDFGELLRVGLDQIGKFQQQALTVDRTHLRPLARLEGLTGSRHRAVDIRCRTGRHRRKGLAAGRVNHLERLTTLGIEPFGANQHALRSRQKLAGSLTDELPLISFHSHVSWCCF